MASGTEMEELKRLITVGKEKGYLTYDELNNALPPDLVSSEQIDDMMMIFDEMDIQIVEGVEMVKSSKKPEEAKTAEEQEPDAAPEAEPESRVTDPVKMYLREMGLVSLLTREGEVEIAKRIEAGEQEVINAILDSQVGMEEILSMGEKLRNDELRLKEMVKDADEEDEAFAETEQRRENILQYIEQIMKLDQENKNLQKKMKSAGTIATKKKHRDTMKVNKEEIVKLVREMRLDKKQTDQIISQIREAVENIGRCQRMAERLLETCGFKCENDLKDTCKILRGKDQAEIVKICKKYRRDKEILLELEKQVKIQKQNVRRFENNIGMSNKKLQETLKKVGVRRKESA